LKISNILLDAGINHKSLLIYKTEPCQGSDVAQNSGVIFKPDGKSSVFNPTKMGAFEDDLVPVIRAHFKHLADEVSYWKNTPKESNDPERCNYFAQQVSTLASLVENNFG
jgi:hypothetical protein